MVSDDFGRKNLLRAQPATCVAEREIRIPELECLGAYVFLAAVGVPVSPAGIHPEKSRPLNSAVRKS
jgi:hypothetical protein